MKKSLLLVAALIASTIINVYASGNTVPVEVASSFQHRFPHVKEVTWKQTNKGEFEADYFLLTKHFHALFDKTGKLVENDLVVNYKNLPDKAHHYIMMNLKGIQISEVIEPLPLMEQDFYIVKGNLEGIYYEMHFRPDGELTKLESK